MIKWTLIVLLALIIVAGVCVATQPPSLSSVSEETHESETVIKADRSSIDTPPDRPGSDLQQFENLIQASLGVAEWDFCHVESDNFENIYTYYPKGWYIYTIKNDSHLAGTPAFHYEQGCIHGGGYLVSPTPMTDARLFDTWMRSPELVALLPKERIEIVYLVYKSQPQKLSLSFTRLGDDNLALDATSKYYGVDIDSYNISAELMTLFAIKNSINISK